ncbi:MAG: hypothetical protein GY906_17920, partial [bacterium]|nr:hypothetical protein [bacterium]
MGLHRAIQRRGHIFRIVAHREKTSKFLNTILKRLFYSCVDFFNEFDGDPWYYLPKPTKDNDGELYLGATESCVLIDTAGGKGVGQADRNDDLYLTEYAEWDHAEDVYQGLVGSVPMDGGRITIDFNAKGTGNDAYTKYQEAKAGVNGYTAIFKGIDDLGDWYPPELLAGARLDLKKRFPAVYPRNDEEMWLHNDLAVFDYEDLQNCTGADYVPTCGRFLHGVDTATGMPDGDWQTCVTLGWDGKAWVEACEPIRRRMPEDAFAELCDARFRQYPGTGVVEANVGSAVLVRLRELATPGLYHHMHRDRDGRQRPKLGFQTTYASKRVMITDMQRHLAEETVLLVTPELIKELREFEWKVDVDGKEARGLAGAPERRGAHDDLGMAAML